MRSRFVSLVTLFRERGMKMWRFSPCTACICGFQEGDFWMLSSPRKRYHVSLGTMINQEDTFLEEFSRTSVFPAVWPLGAVTFSIGLVPGIVPPS